MRKLFDVKATSSSSFDDSSQPAQALQVSKTIPRNTGYQQPPRAPDIAGGVHRPRWRDYTAFVLSGGGARGALQVGALQALFEFGERPDVLVGTSIGAWNGAWLARNPTLDSIRELDTIWRGLHIAQVLLGSEPPRGASQRTMMGMCMLAAARRLASGYLSLYGNIGQRQLISRYIGDMTFEELPVPLRIVAMDITHGRRAVFGSGPVATAALASAAIPGIFPPVQIGDAAYMDGDALDHCSLETALNLGARRLFVLDCDDDACDNAAPLWTGELTPAALRARGNSVHALAAILQRTTQVVSQHQLQEALERIPRGIEVHVIRPGLGVPGTILDFDHAAAWIEHGYAATQAYLREHLMPTTAVANAS